jgi:nucleotide-binding universal stress UspA family protein
MINKILVPTDYSKASTNALEFALTIAASNNASLQILHVNDTVSEFDDNSSTEKSELICEAMAGNFQQSHGVKTEIIFTEGIVGHAIVKTIFENKVDLVIMGSHGKAGYRDLFIGSNSYYTIKRATCPVLLIPEHDDWGEFCKVLLPIRQALFSPILFEFIENLTRHNTKKCLLQIVEIGPVEKKTGTTAALSKAIQEVNIKNKKNKIEISLSNGKSKDIAEFVLQRARTINADLIVIPQGMDLVSNPFFVGPFSQKIINHAKSPVLSLLRTSHN